MILRNRNMSEWICIILGLLFIYSTQAIKNSNLCIPKKIDVFVQIQPSATSEAATDIFQLNCSNWGNIKPNFTLADDVKDFFTIEYLPNIDILDLEHDSFVLRTNRSVSAGTHDTILKVKNGSNVINLLHFTVTVEKLEIEVNLSRIGEPFIIVEKIPVGTVIGEINVTSEYLYNRTVQTYGVPDVFKVSQQVEQNGRIFVHIKSQLDIDTIRQRERCGCFDTDLQCPYNLTCFDSYLKYDFSVKVENAITSVEVTVDDINDHAPVCPMGTQRLQKLDYMVFDFCSVCKDPDYTVSNPLQIEIIKESNCDGFWIFTYYDFNATDNDDNATDYFFYYSYDICILRVNVENNTKLNPCQYVLDVSDGKSTTPVSVLIRYVSEDSALWVTVGDKITCPAGLDNMQQMWKEGLPGHFMNMSCPIDSKGNVKRFCSPDGAYEDPIYNCTANAIQDLLDVFIVNDDDEANTTEALKTLSEVTSPTGKTNGTLHLGDIEAVNKIMSKIADVINSSSSELRNDTDNFIEVASNILSESTAHTWKSSIKQEKAGAETVIENIDKFTEKIATRDVEMEVPKPNLYLKIGQASNCSSNLQFPARGDSDKIPEWANDVPDAAKISCSEGYNSFSGVLYRNLSQIITTHSGNGSKDHQINAPIVSFSLYPKPNGTLDKPIEIVFGLYNKSLVNPNCSYWSETEKTWSSDGCWLDSYNTNDNMITCKCNHLTNFAILMSPSFRATGVHHEALSIITIIGSVFSMVCLVLTLILYVVFWNYVKSVKTIIHINLSSCLFISYLLFITGIGQTQNPVLCKAVAIMLHLVLVALFFTMLVEGLTLAYMVLIPMSTRKPGIQLLIGAYILSFVIVGISLAIGFDGYGGKRFCWLSNEHGLIWAFIGPAVFVCVANIVIIVAVFWRMFGTAAMSRKSGSEKAKTALRNLCLLVPTMGLSWILGIFAVNEGTVLFQYLFALINSLQGALIFVLHAVLNKKIKEAVRHRYTRWQSSRSFSSGGSKATVTSKSTSSTATTKM